MSFQIVETSLVLTIQTARGLKWDDCVAFKQGVQQLKGTRAVDGCAHVEGVGPVMVEAKDFRAAAIENARRLQSGELADEVAGKVRDTLAGMIWACRRGIGEPWHESFVARFSGRDKLLVLLWLEEDVVDAAGATALAVTIRSKLGPHIPAKVIVTNSLLEKAAAKPLAWIKYAGRRSPRLSQRPRR